MNMNDIVKLEDELLRLQRDKCYKCSCYILGTSCRKDCKHADRIDQIEDILEELGEL